LAGSFCPAISASIIFRPLRPMTSVITESNFNIGVLERLLYPQDMARLFTAQLLARAQQGADLLGRVIRYEARSDQAMRQQIRHPVGILHIGLAAGHVLDVCGIGQHQLEVIIGQDVPNRLPIDAGLAVVVEKVRTSFTTLPSITRRKQATTVSLCTSRPQHRGYKTSKFLPHMSPAWGSSKRTLEIVLGGHLRPVATG